MHGIIPQLFDCWADPVAHLLLLKSSMAHSVGTLYSSTVREDKSFVLPSSVCISST